MVEKIKNAIIYDVELYRNLLMIGFYGIRTNRYLTYSVYPDLQIDERQRIVNLVESRLLIGYNNRNYDDLVLNYIFQHRDFEVEELWMFSQNVIKNKHDIKLFNYKYGKFFESYDISELIRIGPVCKNLKLVGCNLKHPKLQDLPIEYDKFVQPDEFQLMKDYNINDLNITRLVLDSQMQRLEIRETVSKHNGVDLWCESDTTICKRLFEKYYSEQTGLDKREFRDLRTERGEIKFADLIYDYIQFESPELIEFLNWLKTLTLPAVAKGKKRKWTHKLKMGDLKLTIALGGIHSDDEPLIDDAYDAQHENENCVLVEKEDLCILDLDVTSQYPNAIIHNKVAPEHLDKKIVVDFLKFHTANRTEHKKLYKQTKDKFYNDLQSGEKITLNSFYGLFGSEYFFLYDPKATYIVTLNNQLCMLMLIEQLQKHSYNVISSNTDGITLHVKRSDLDDIRNIYRKWEQTTGFTLEETFYVKLFRRDVNNYLAVVLGENGKNDVKAKGCFLLQEDKDLTKGYRFPIIAIALRRYFLDKIPISQTIRNHRDIYDFCRCEKTDKKFTLYLQTVYRKYKIRGGKNLQTLYVRPHRHDTVLSEERIQSSVRFYVARPLKIESYTANDGYAHQTYTGHCVVKKGMRDGARYQIVSFEKEVQLKTKKTIKLFHKIYDVIDDVFLQDDDTAFSNKTIANKECVILNKHNEGDKPQVENCIDFQSGRFVRLFNNYFDVENWKDYMIDYSFYIEEVQKIIDKVEGN